MRYSWAFFGLPALIATQGCGWLEAIAPKCTQEQIVVTWPITITRGNSVTTPLLTFTLTQSNIDKTEFDALRQTLTEGGSPGSYNVTWTVPAFDINGGFIAFTHTAALVTGQMEQVSRAFQGGGWGAQPAGSRLLPAISVRADNFVATSATGSMTVLAASPLRLGIDITTANVGGETMRLTGQAGFSYHKVVALCD